MPTELVSIRLKRRVILLEKLIPDPNPGPTDQEIWENAVAQFTDAEIDALCDGSASEELLARWAKIPRRGIGDFSDLTDEQLDQAIDNFQAADS